MPSRTETKKKVVSVHVHSSREALAEPSNCIHRWFEAQAARTPEAVAVIFEEETLTYAALNCRANQLARALRRLGIGPESLVGICAHRSVDMIVGLLGILKSGGAYLPLAPDYPVERLAFVIADAEVSVLLTQEALRGRMPDQKVQILCLDSASPWFTAEADDDLPDGAEPDNLAYVIYTSGSTGQPKGVEIAHRGVCNNLRWRQTTFPLTDQDRILQTYSFSFDPSVWAFFWPLTAGAALILPAPDRHGDPAYLCNVIARQQISVLGFSPSLLSVLLEHPDIARCRSLRHVFCGGEPLTADLQARFFARLPAELHNVYGPTEATIDAAWWTCRREEEGGPVPIGYPLPGTAVYLLGEDGQQVSEGSLGELSLAGVGLARGYRRRPELTSAQFKPNPFDPDRFPTLYRTGDLVRRRDDGALEYQGRLDQQVKVRGFRIELGEIEAHLTLHPDVREVVVLAHQNQNGDKQLTAYIVPEVPPPSRCELRQYVRAALPDYMTPRVFVFLEALPLSPNGKLERRLLPVPDASDWERNSDLVSAQTPLQQILVEVFEALLETRPLGIRDDFFEWGGDSLLAARLLERIERLTGHRLPLAEISVGATVERLADYLARSARWTPIKELAASPLLQQWATGSGRPFFFWHGSFTGGLYCGDLARHLVPGQPFYAFSPHGMDGMVIPPTIEAMAREYVALLRGVQPAGPYRLGGFCNGGLVAYEVARQLQAQGQEVDFLALIEMILPPTLLKLRLHSIVCRLSRQFGLRAKRQAHISSALQTGVIPLLLVLKKVREAWGRGARLLTRNHGPDWSLLIPEPYRKTAAYYNLRDYDGEITLIAVEESVAHSSFPLTTGWLNIAQQVAFDIIPGGHYDSLKSHLPELAACLRKRLNKQ